MGTESLAAALEREHHEIDEGIAAFAASPWNPQPLARAIRALRRHITWRSSAAAMYRVTPFPRIVRRALS